MTLAASAALKQRPMGALVDAAVEAVVEVVVEVVSGTHDALPGARIGLAPALNPIAP